MDSLIEILTNYGYVGMLISAFLAGSIFPLSSEVVMLALLAAGLDPWMGFFSFLPVIGEGITIVLGLMRSNVAITVISVIIGKFLRYALIIYGVEIFV